MRMLAGDINIYYIHDVLTPNNVRAASYGSDTSSGTLVPEVGDIINDFHGWNGEEYEKITVRVIEVRQFGAGVTAFDVRVTTVS